MLITADYIIIAQYNIVQLWILIESSAASVVLSRVSIPP